MRLLLLHKMFNDVEQCDCPLRLGPTGDCFTTLSECFAYLGQGFKRLKKNQTSLRLHFLMIFQTSLHLRLVEDLQTAFVWRLLGILKSSS